MAIEVFNRYEKKYLLTQEQYEMMLVKIDEYMEADSHCKDGKTYNIANIYYDTQNDELIARSILKPVYKEKLRLRSYGVPGMNDIVFLEIKKKFKGKVNKRRTKLELTEAYDFTDNGIKPQGKPYINEQVVNEIEFFLKRYSLLPKLYLTYDRRAYFGKNDSDFRLTFDTNIRSRRDDVRLEAGNYGEQLLVKGIWLMEMKASHAVPMWFAKVLEEMELYSVSFSKYGTEYKRYITRMNNIKGEMEECSKVYSNQQQSLTSQRKAQSLVS